MNPFNILNDFERWFIYEKCRIVDGLTDEEARTNVQFLTNGWKLVEGMTYGGWTFAEYRNPFVPEEEIDRFIQVWGGVHINKGDFS